MKFVKNLASSVQLPVPKLVNEYQNNWFMIECVGFLEWFYCSCEKVPKTVTIKNIFSLYKL